MTEIFKGGSLVDWRQALEPVNSFLASQLHEEVDPYQTVRDMGLPAPLYLSFDSPSAFLDCPIEQLKPLQDMGVDNFYVGLRPHAPDLRKYRQLGLAADEVAPYIESVVRVEDYPGYNLRVAEYAPAEYGATIIINPSGRTFFEMVKGEMASLAIGVVSPEFKAESDRFTGVMRYSFDDVSLRTMVWSAISRIPNIPDETAFRARREPGYYEVSFVRRKGRTIPVFYDYKPNPVFTVTE